MESIVDARGYACPQPIMMFVDKIKEIQKGSFDILVDNEISKENICRTAKGKLWKVNNIDEKEDYFVISVTK